MSSEEVAVKVNVDVLELIDKYNIDLVKTIEEFLRVRGYL